MVRPDGCRTGQRELMAGKRIEEFPELEGSVNHWFTAGNLDRNLDLACSG